MSVAEGLASVRDRIARAAAAASRDPADVKLVAVSKGKPAAMIREAYALGQRDFGENYAQELTEKAAELADLPDVAWHFIGHLQSNKARHVARVAHLVQTVDSPALARELGKRAKGEGYGDGKTLAVLIEVNVGGEAQKHGASPAELGEMIAAVSAEPALALRGLMTMPPHDLEAARRAFEALASLQGLHGGRARLPELSIGMSDDLEIAIACGATLVRVGTAIFGAR
ncbi:MAG: YggS family pyridoxal phosphate-dependent enzyme [Labilithrix sp.]|nr:YggS family pyridoxal phosphate-dependent enzyme [Labilithrix sp.]